MTKKEPVKAGKKQVDGRKRTQFKKGQSGNPSGKKKGTKNFSTLFQEAIKRIAKMEKVSPKDIDFELILTAVDKARIGNYSFFKDIMDRRFGKAKEDMDVSLTVKDIITKKQFDAIFANHAKDNNPNGKV